MLDAVIFDFDGVIADSELLHYRALAHAFKKYGIDMSKEEHYRTYLGYSDFDNIHAVSKDYNKNWSPQQVKDIFNIKTAKFEQLAKDDALIISGVTAFIRMLQRNNIPMAICSGATARDIDLMLNGTDFKQVFLTIVTADDVKEGKPHPQGYQLAIKNLSDMLKKNIAPEKCIVVEDSYWGLEAAKNAGTKTIAVTNTYSEDKLKPLASLVVDNLSSIKMDSLEGILK
jgi:beta-phosphoglucomutase